MDRSFLSPFIAPDKWRLLWYELNPYSPKLLMYLHAIESPYVTGQVPSPSDTVLFLRVCSTKDYDIFSAKKESLFDKLLFLKLVIFRNYHAKLLKAISIYIKECTQAPHARIKTSDKSESVVKRRSIPDILMLCCLCMNKLNMSEREAFNMSISKLSWYGVTISAIEGAEVDILSDDDINNADTLLAKIDEFQMEQAEKLKIAMINGKIKKRKIILA